jgi:SPP1 gp7 family putative phage head morphogenesis protein
MPEKKPKLKYSDKQLSDLVKDVYSGKVNQYDLPEDLYFALAEYLKTAVYKGFGGALADFKLGTPDYALLSELRENIYMFSAAKSYQQVREMTDKITDDEGIKRSFKDFKEDAVQIFGTYNEDYLKAEFETAYASAQMGEKWNRIEENADLLPYLILSVVEDDATSDICEPLDGICAPVGDSIWDEFYPPNHFNCRTTVEQLNEQDGKGKLSSTEDRDQATQHADEHMQDEFKMNVGKDKVVFSDEHPYFDVQKGDTDYAQRNFDLPIPKNDDE